MLPIKTILHPTDFSEFSDAGFQLACSLANDYGAQLILVHVEPPAEIIHGAYYAAPVSTHDDVEAAKEKLLKIQPTNDTVKVEHYFERGDAADEIIRLADEHGADLIVMGTHGRTGLSRVLVGSVAEKVLRKANCPVVTVKKPLSKEATDDEATPAAANAH